MLVNVDIFSRASTVPMWSSCSWLVHAFTGRNAATGEEGLRKSGDKESCMLIDNSGVAPDIRSAVREAGLGKRCSSADTG